MGSELLRKALMDDEIHVRLVNWGRWLRDDPGAGLGYPTKSPFVFSPRSGGMVADLDAEHIENIVSTMCISKNIIPLGELYAFILKVEYADRSERDLPHVSQRAEDVRRRFKRPCAERTYYYHLSRAKKAVEVFVETIK